MNAAVPMLTRQALQVAAASTADSDLATTTISPARILDTRPGAASLGGTKTKIGAGETRRVVAAGLGSIPASASGVVVNITTVNATTSDSYLTLFPTGSPMPTASMINPEEGAVSTNVAVVRLGSDGAFNIYNFTGEVDVIIDVTAFMTRSLATSVLAAEADIDTAEADIDTAEADIDTAEADIDTAEADIDTVETDVVNARTVLIPVPVHVASREIRMVSTSNSNTWTTVSSGASQGSNCSPTKWCTHTASVRNDAYSTAVLSFTAYVKRENYDWDDQICLRLRTLGGDPLTDTATCIDSATDSPDLTSGVYEYFDVDSPQVSISTLSDGYYLEFTLESDRTLGDGTPYPATDFRLMGWELKIDPT